MLQNSDDKNNFLQNLQKLKNSILCVHEVMRAGTKFREDRAKEAIQKMDALKSKVDKFCEELYKKIDKEK